jgi:hypothetical protein
MLFIILRFVLLGPFIGGGAFLITSHLVENTLTSPSLNEVGLVLISVLPAAILTSFLSMPVRLFASFATGAVYCYILNKHTKRNPNKMLRLSLVELLDWQQAQPSGCYFHREISRASRKLRILYRWHLQALLEVA